MCPTGRQGCANPWKPSMGSRDSQSSGLKLDLKTKQTTLLSKIEENFLFLVIRCVLQVSLVSGLYQYLGGGWWQYLQP